MSFVILFLALARQRQPTPAGRRLPGGAVDAGLRVLQDPGSADLPGEAARDTRAASRATRTASRGSRRSPERRDRVDRRAVASELRGVAAGGRARRSGGEPVADASAREVGRRRSVPRRRQALAVAERPRVPDAGRVGADRHGAGDDDDVGDPASTSRSIGRASSRSSSRSARRTKATARA